MRVGQRLAVFVVCFVSFQRGEQSVCFGIDRVPLVLNYVVVRLELYFGGFREVDFVIDERRGLRIVIEYRLDSAVKPDFGKVRRLVRIGVVLVEQAFLRGRVDNPRLIFVVEVAQIDKQFEPRARKFFGVGIVRVFLFEHKLDKPTVHILIGQEQLVADIVRALVEMLAEHRALVFILRLDVTERGHKRKSAEARKHERNGKRPQRAARRAEHKTRQARQRRFLFADIRFDNDGDYNEQQPRDHKNSHAADRREHNERKI